MSSVFSGGLVYEYSEEGNGYGLVTISGNTVTPSSQFSSLVAAYSSATDPSGNGGASTATAASTCPSANSNWTPTNDELPAIPSAAEALMKKGAGTGPGFKGDGSQNSGSEDTESTGTATAGSGGATETGSASASSGTKKSDGARAPAVEMKVFSVMGVMLLGMVGGMAML